MRQTIIKINTTTPIVDPKTGMVNDQFRLFLLQTAERGLLIGTGSPEGVVAAQQGAEYMDEAGAAGSVKWIKQLADISGDKSQGWVAIG